MANDAKAMLSVVILERALAEVWHPTIRRMAKREIRRLKKGKR